MEPAGVRRPPVAIGVSPRRDERVAVESKRRVRRLVGDEPGVLQAAHHDSLGDAEVAGESDDVDSGREGFSGTRSPSLRTATMSSAT